MLKKKILESGVIIAAALCTALLPLFIIIIIEIFTK